MIVLFSSNSEGGILQFVSQALDEISLLGYDVVCFVPNGAKVTFSDKNLSKVIWYNPIKTINPYNKQIKLLSKQIETLEPVWLWCFDNLINTCLLIHLICKKVKTSIIMHDAGTQHSTFKMSFKQRVYRYLRSYYSRLAESLVHNIITLSPESSLTYIKLNPQYSEKVYMLTLGAHIPKCSPSCPKEIEDLQGGFNLFFGIIDRYKGIDTLLRNYIKSETHTPLVIAGSGKILEEERKQIDQDPRIFLINRYITDEEMIYLFMNSQFVITPYRDATQSGIIPIAYKFGKPVVSSNVKGLTQFIEDNKTGKICTSDIEYEEAFLLFDNLKTRETFGLNARSYYEKNMDWNTNISKMIQYLGIIDK